MHPKISCVNLLQLAATLTSQVEHGGPLTVEVDGHHVVAGVSSWGLGCGQGDGRQFAVYAEVAQANTFTWFLLNSTGSYLSCGPGENLD